MEIIRRENIGRFVRVAPAPVYTPVNYGLLYNWYAATDEREIAAEGWEVPENSDFNTLISYLGGYEVVGGKLKEVGTIYWSSPNGGATNEVGFNGRGAGIRRTDGLNSFDQIKTYLVIAVKDLNITEYPYQGFYLDYGSGGSDFYSSETNVGYSVRLIKTTTPLTHGQTGTYTGNDGKVYRTICIGTQEWLADNLCETKYRNGDTIPEVTDNAAWAALTTGALCAFNNDWSNV